MKVRGGFVSNSSSCSFIIKNKLAIEQTLEDFIRENDWMVKAYFNEFKDAAREYTMQDVIEDARKHDDTLWPGENTIECSDHRNESILEAILHYYLSDGGESDSWKWRFEESHH